jgi:hypothetical protein
MSRSGIRRTGVRSNASIRATRHSVRAPVYRDVGEAENRVQLSSWCAQSSSQLAQ